MGRTSKILVTGANGHVGFNLVKMLLEDGCSNLRVSVRDKDDPSRAAALKALRVEDIVSLDVRDEPTFRKVCAGVQYLFHVAATYRFHTGSAQADAELIEDSMAGVRSAMNAAAAHQVKRVILTSSIVTLPVVADGAAVPDEACWTAQTDVPYIRAKTEAEKLAWSMARGLGVELVTVLPSAVIGPHFGRGTQSTDCVLAIMKGSMRTGTITARPPFIDVRDIVRGHTLAAQKGGSGHYILAADAMPAFPEVIETMRQIDPKVPNTLMIMPKAMYAALLFFDWLSSKTLGSHRTLTAAFAESVKSGSMLANSSKAKRELGCKAAVSLEQSLRDKMDELRAGTQLQLSAAPVRGS